MRRSSNALELLESRSLLSATPVSYSLLNDISAGSQSSLPEQFHSLNGKVLFLAYDASHGQMLWSTDGTPAGTAMIDDLNPNPQNGKFQGYGQSSIVIGNEMYFAGTDAAHGTELWKTDGTTAGTQLVGDLNPGIDGSDFSGFADFNGKLAFQSLGQLWISDGTPGGTHSLGAYNPAGVGGATDRMAVLGSDLYFSRYASSNPTGHDTGELWKTDGTVAGTTMVVDLSPGSDGRDAINSTSSNLIAVGNALYFAADDGTHGWELYRSDGTTAGTTLVADVAPAPATGSPSDGSYPSDLTNVNGTLYFTASMNGATPALYKLDSTGQPQIVSSKAQSPQNLVAAGNHLYFTATDSAHGRELWRSDGTAAGTQMVADINPGTADAGVAGITAANGRIYFSADDGTHGPELWTSDGTTAGTLLFAAADQGPTGSSPGDFTAFGEHLIFEANLFGYGEEPVTVALPAATAPVPDPVGSPVTRTSGPTVRLMASSKSEIKLKFSQDVSASFGRTAFALIDRSTGKRISPENIRVAYDRKTNIARITFRNKIGNVMPSGHYRLRINAAKVNASTSFGLTIQSSKPHLDRSCPRKSPACTCGAPGEVTRWHADSLLEQHLWCATRSVDDGATSRPQRAPARQR